MFLSLVVAFTGQTLADAVDLAGRPVSDVKLDGLKRIDSQLVFNQVRLVRGDPYDANVVKEDIIRITHLGRFASVQAQVTPQDDGSVVVTYVLQEQPLLADVSVVGNKALDDQELLPKVGLKAGDPVDDYLIQRGKREIEALYEKEGYFLASITVDEKVLEESNTLIYRIREGPRVKVRAIRFEGNDHYSDDELRSKIRTNTSILIFRSGDLNRDALDNDVASIRDFYQQAGYLDAQVGRRVDLSPNQRDATIVFFIEEGKQYTVANVRVEGATIFPDEQVKQVLDLKAGDVYSLKRTTDSQESVRDLYGKLGYIEARVVIERLFHEDEPIVDVVVRIEEGKPYTVGTVTVSGNTTTKSHVVFRQLRGVEPGRPFDGAGMRRSEKRLNDSPLFQNAKVEVLGDVNDPIRDVLVEVQEKNTGSLSFGAGISSDAGILGAIDLTQRNFDITDYPESVGELFTGKAFRGAGQYFALSLQPGTETSQYSVSFREPYFLETQYILDTSLFYWTRQRDVYDEQRIGGRVGIGQRFGDVWSAFVNTRFEQIDIKNIDFDAPVDVFAVMGNSLLTMVSLNVNRSTVDDRLFPTRGSQLEMELAQAVGGDYEFTRVGAEYHKFWTVDEDFFERKTVLSLGLETGYILQDSAPIFERYFAGGHRSFRGFGYRGVGPRGIRGGGPFVGMLGPDPVGGVWLFLAKVEYNFPVYQEVVRMVVFIDSGTVDTDISFSKYRVAVGAGLRLKVPILGQAPFAFDFAYPLVKYDGDDTRIFSFDIALPF